LTTVDALVLDLLEFVGDGERPYDEVMAAWRTSCPRLPVWEEADECGFVERRRRPDGVVYVALSPAGVEYLRRRRAVTPAR
jgi:D-3-phosphoglycerate dehydrogenase